MAQKPSAGTLRHRVSFAKRADVDDGYGNTKSDFVEQFSCAADLRHRGGSEAVQAARLEGRHVLGVYVRSSSSTRQITAQWRMTDVRAGEVYAVLVADTVTDPAWVYLTVQSGAAA